MKRSPKARTLQTTETTFEIIELLLERDGERLTEVAAALGLANSTVYNHLVTLEERGFVVRDGGEYRVGLEFLRIGGQARDQNNINKLSHSAVEKLAEQTGEQAHFIVEENGRGYHVYLSPGEQAVSVDTRAGKRIYLHANASGKAILAHLDDERVDAILDRWGMPQITDDTITDREELKERLETILERGYAFNREEHIVGWRGVAAPVKRQSGDVLGALCIGGPTHRLKGEYLRERLPEQLLEIVNELELEVEFA